VVDHDMYFVVGVILSEQASKAARKVRIGSPQRQDDGDFDARFDFVGKTRFPVQSRESPADDIDREQREPDEDRETELHDDIPYFEQTGSRRSPHRPTSPKVRGSRFSDPTSGRIGDGSRIGPLEISPLS
jgi:hypothetical protein